MLLTFRGFLSVISIYAKEGKHHKFRLVYQSELNGFVGN